MTDKKEFKEIYKKSNLNKAVIYFNEHPEIDKKSNLNKAVIYFNEHPEYISLLSNKQARKLNLFILEEIIPTLLKDISNKLEKIINTK